MRYPKNARRSGVEGKVFVSFIVEKNGIISGAAVIKGFDGECDAEGVRVVSESKKWKPGYDKDGNAVRVRFTLPIIFSLAKRKV